MNDKYNKTYKNKQYNINICTYNKIININNIYISSATTLRSVAFPRRGWNWVIFHYQHY